MRSLVYGASSLIALGALLFLVFHDNTSHPALGILLTCLIGGHFVAPRKQAPAKKH